MKFIQSIAIAIVLMPVLTSCRHDSGAGHQSESQSRPSFLKRDPLKDLDDSWGRDDRRFLGIRGMSVDLPGANDIYDLVDAKYGIRIIAGHGDEMTAAEAGINAEAAIYAAKYNALLRRRLGLELPTSQRSP